MRWGNTVYGGLGYRRLRTKVVEKAKLPRLKDFSRLSLGDLRKVKAHYELYHSEDDKRLAARQRYEAAHDEYKRKERLRSDLIKKLDVELNALESEAFRIYAARFEQGFITSLITNREKIKISLRACRDSVTHSKLIIKTLESVALKTRLDEKTVNTIPREGNEQSFKLITQAFPPMAITVILIVSLKRSRRLR